MTAQGLHSRPVVKINGRTIVNLKNVSYNNGGSNQLTTLNCTFDDPELINYRLFNKKIEFYVNEGVAESFPIFTGFIRDIFPSDTSITVMAYDARILISGREANPVVITDKKNYDGYTAVQFITDIIQDLNSNETLIDLTALSETNPAVSMSGVRSVSDAPYDLFAENINKAVAADDPLEPLNYVIDMLGNSLVVTSKRAKAGNGIRFSRSDGINSLNIKRRAPITKATVIGADGASGTFQYGTSPAGEIGIIHNNQDLLSNADCTNEAIKLVMAERNEIDEITLEANKGYDLGLNNVIYLDVDDLDIRGEHRIASKRIDVKSDGSIRIRFSLDKLPPTLSEYLQKI
jgi:hypothetical protein